MEEDDDQVPEPDEKGHLVLSNRAWVNLETSVWTLADRIVKLDISYNHIVEIPPQIGELKLLRELIGSFNKIVTIPKELGGLKRLRRLVLNTNRIRFLPPEIGSMDLLEELILSENLIEELPATIARVQNLRILKLTNNKLKKIPYEMADVLTLEEFDCGNNPHLDGIPAKWRGDTESVLFTCRVHRDYNIQMAEVLAANAELAKHTQYIEQDNLLLKERILQSQVKIDDLHKNIPPKIAKKMEAAAKKARELEMTLENDDDNRRNSKCIIS